MHKKLEAVIKYGFLHIPTGIIIANYDFNLNSCEESTIEIPQKELTFSTRDKAIKFLDFITVTGLERKKGIWTAQEKEVYENMSFYGAQFKDNTILNLANISIWLYSYRTIVSRYNKIDPFEWSPEQTVTLISEKMNSVECIELNHSNFFRASSLSGNKWNPEEFKKLTGYKLNPINLYPKKEFEIIEIPSPVIIKRPSSDEFRKLITKIISDNKTPEHIKELFTAYIIE